MSLLKPEYPVKYESDEMRGRAEQMAWKSSRSNGDDEKFPKWSAEFERSWYEKFERVAVTQRAEDNKATVGQVQLAAKTQEQIEMEKTLYRENSIYKILQECKKNFPDVVDTHSKDIVVVADRYPREDIRGLSEAELIGQEDKRKREGELTTDELRRWKKFSRREAVYSLTPENFENLMRRFERGRQLQNSNYEEIRSRRPQVEHRGNIQDNRCRPRSPSLNTPSYMSRDRTFQDRDEERRRPRISRSRSKSPTRNVEIDRRRDRMSRSRSKSPVSVERRLENPRSRSKTPRSVELERRRERNPRSRSKSPGSVELEWRRERTPRSRSKSPRIVEVERRGERNFRSRSKSPRSVKVERRHDTNPWPSSRSPRRSVEVERRYEGNPQPSSRSPRRSVEVERRREGNPRPSSRSPRRSGGYERMYNSRY